jgi:hypothetical protein
LKERLLEKEKAMLVQSSEELERIRHDIDVADQLDDAEISRLRKIIIAREEKQRRAYDESYREAQKQQEREGRRLDDYLRWCREQVEKDLAEQQRRQTEKLAEEVAQRSLACRHDGSWKQVPGRAICPGCGVSGTSLMKCSDCEQRACARCQRGMATGPKRKRR